MARAVHRLLQQSITARSKAVLAQHIQVSILLPGKGHLGQIFSGGRRTDRDGNLRAVRKGAVRHADRSGKRGRHLAFCKTGADFGRNCFERRAGRLVAQPGKPGGNHFCEAIGGDEVLISARGDQETTRHGNPARERRARLAPFPPACSSVAKGELKRRIQSVGDIDIIVANVIYFFTDLSIAQSVRRYFLAVVQPFLSSGSSWPYLSLL